MGGECKYRHSMNWLLTHCWDSGTEPSVSHFLYWSDTFVSTSVNHFLFACCSLMPVSTESSPKTDPKLPPCRLMKQRNLLLLTQTTTKHRQLKFEGNLLNCPLKWAAVHDGNMPRQQWEPLDHSQQSSSNQTQSVCVCVCVFALWWMKWSIRTESLLTHRGNVGD